MKSLIDGNHIATPVRLSNCEMYDIDYSVVVTGLEVTTNNNSASSILVVPTKKCDQGWIYNRNIYEDSASMHVGVAIWELEIWN